MTGHTVFSGTDDRFSGTGHSHAIFLSYTCDLLEENLARVEKKRFCQGREKWSVREFLDKESKAFLLC
jgi:hypothetical protein